MSQQFPQQPQQPQHQPGPPPISPDGKSQWDPGKGKWVPIKKKHTGCKVAGGVLGVFTLIGIIIGATTSGGDEPVAAPADEAAQVDKKGGESDTKPAKMGDEVKAGSFTFTVSGIECGIDRVGGEFGETAQGQYCLVDLSISNDGNEAVTFFEDDNKLVDGQSREYSSSVDSIYLENGDWLLTDINPGNTAEGQLLFDIPDEVEPTKIVLAGSGLFDNPVEVALS